MVSSVRVLLYSLKHRFYATRASYKKMAADDAPNRATRARAPHDGDDDDDDARERARFSASDADARAMRRASARESTREDARGRRTRNRRARIARRAETRERCARERDARGERRRRGWRRGRVLDVVDAREGGNLSLIHI